MSQVKAKPDGYHTISPYIIVKDSQEFIKFTGQVFGATLLFNMQNDDGSTKHGELQIGDSKIMFSQECTERSSTPIMLYLYLDNADETYNKAMNYGLKSVMEPQDTFYGDRNAGFEDKSGNQWWVATHIKDVTPEELEKGAKEYGKKH